jgi:hypothetical protein
MVTLTDVRRIALEYPGAAPARGRLAVGVRTKGKLKEFVWVWMERVDPKKPRIPNPKVVAVRVPSLAEKERLIAESPDVLFTEPHYKGFPAVLVRLDVVRLSQLKSLIAAAWRCQAPIDLRIASDGS